MVFFSLYFSSSLFRTVRVTPRALAPPPNEMGVTIPRGFLTELRDFIRSFESYIGTLKSKNIYATESLSQPAGVSLSSKPLALHSDDIPVDIVAVLPDQADSDPPLVEQLGTCIPGLLVWKFRRYKQIAIFRDYPNSQPFTHDGLNICVLLLMTTGFGCTALANLHH